MPRDLDNALLAALERGDAGGACGAIEAGADPDASRDDGPHALEIALMADTAAFTSPVVDGAIDPEAAGETVEQVLKLLLDPGGLGQEGGGGDAGGDRASSAELIELLLDAGADRTRLPNSLHWAVQLGRDDLVRRFLADPIEEDRKQILAAFCLAADRGREDILDALFESGIRPAQTPSGSPVAEALERGQDGVFRRFVDHRLWLDAKDIFGHTPLELASLNGDMTALRALLEAGAEVDVAGNFRFHPGGKRRIVRKYHESTALHVAVRSGEVAIAEALLAAGADFDRRDGLGRTALDWAGKLGREDLVEVLRQHGARPAAPPPALSVVMAAEKGDSAALAAAVESGADADSRDARRPTRGMTPLMLAARAGHADCIRVLLAAGASVDLHDDPGRSSLGGANMAFDSDETSETLRGYGVCPKRTALHYAAEAGHAATIDILLAAGAAPSPKDFRSLAPLHLAALGGHLEAVRRLLAGKARVTVTDFDKQTPLHFAAEAGNEPIARALLAAGAKPERPDQYLKTPLRLARSTGNRKLIELLRHPPPRAKR